MSIELIDQQQRLQALDISESFIVQAPAGSGKTELLTQRFLALLASVKQPEEIIALTFTRKAAAEMRERIIAAITIAAEQPRPNTEHAQRSYDLATAALQKNETQQWHLLTNPNRLRIFTIDALSAKLVKQMPLCTQFISQASISDDAQSLYQQAARKLLTDLNPKQPWCQPLTQLLLHLDNRQGQVEALMMQMLAKRDQWLPYIFTAKNTAALRERLELGLTHCNDDILASLEKNLPEEFEQQLLPLLLYAASHVDVDSPMFALQDMEQLPNCTLANKQAWLVVADFLLTKADRGWRKQVTKRQGFPAPSSFTDKADKQFAKDAKQRMTELLQDLAEHEQFRLQLCQLMDAPPPVYDDGQWQMVDALLELLPFLAAQLNLLFQQQNVVDFIEISSMALHALGHFDEPSELALQLDYQISHLLIDEFQDTSTTQYRLLDYLTAGWQAGDGRSLFLVGDPMQSIYRFRQAQVGLFLQAQQYGLANVALTSLQLSANFRSKQTIIDWVNQSFVDIFPRAANPAIGAVPYHASQAIHAADESSQVALHPCHDRNDEAQHIVNLIKSNQQSQPTQTIAILVSARSHLSKIIQQFKQENIAYHAIELDSLADSMVVSDLWSLTKALLFLNDRVAWLSLLRAPWCGLTLDDLHHIAAANTTATILDNINNPNLMAKLSEDGQIQLQRCQTIINAAFANRGRLPLREWIEQSWLALGGPACLNDENQIDEADYFFKELDKHPQNPYQFDFSLFEKRLHQLYADNNSDADNPVQLMTIHKSKGLEFDVVILPGLDKQSIQHQAQLMLWEERTGQHAQNDLLIAPIKAAEFDSDPIYHYLKLQDQTKDQFEKARLLYVAATRAKAQLHLYAAVSHDDEGELKAPSKKSLLNHLWPQHQQAFATLDKLTTQDDAEQPIREPQSIYRLSDNWHNLYPHDELLPHVNGHNPSNTHEYRWQKTNARHTGTLIHSYLQRMTEDATEQWPNYIANDEQAYWRQQLRELGISLHDIDDCVAVIKSALQQVIADEQALWLLSSHQDAHSEWAISAVIDDQVQQLVIDRSFIDEQGTRWIIDYKTASPQNQDIASFIQLQQQQYTKQLQTYAQALSLQEQRPIKCALYFPLITTLHSWDYQSQ